MVDFLKIELDDYSQPADVRLRDEQEYGDTVIVQAHFNDSGTTILKMRSDRKSKKWDMTTQEMNALCEAWTEYQARVEAHATEKEARTQKAIADAKKLASSIHFDMESLNVHLEKEDDLWTVRIPAIGVERYAYDHELLTVVQNVLENRKSSVERAKRLEWSSHEWKEILASYDRAMEKNAEQGEPPEISEARCLLKEHLHITEWANCSIYPGSSPNTWSFDGPFGNGGEISMPDESPAQLLADIKEYVERKETDKVLDQMDRESGIY